MSIRKARELRKNMTPPERRLWNALKLRPEGFKFRKQHEHGAYYLDFFCYEAALACRQRSSQVNDHPPTSFAGPPPLQLQGRL